MRRPHLHVHMKTTARLTSHLSCTIFTALVIPLVGLTGGCSPSNSTTPPTTAPSSDDSNGKPTDAAVIIYCSIDREFAEPILADFEKSSGVRVHRQYDTEAGKTTGLVNRLLAERENPRADVWWSSEIFGTMQLADQGILAPFRPESATEIPDRYRDSSDRWTAFGLRGRVIAYDPKRVSAADLPKRWADLTDARFKRRFALADPRFGTTRGHMATLYQLWGPEQLSNWYEDLRANEFRRADGNSLAVLLVTRGTVDFAATDTDDVIVARERGNSIAMCFPDHDPPDGSRQIPGSLWIPCSAGLVSGARHRSAAESLLNHILSVETERQLALSDSKNVPVRASITAALDAEPGRPPFSNTFANPDDTLPDGRAKPFPYEAKVDYAEAAAVLSASDRLVVDVLLR